MLSKEGNISPIRRTPVEVLTRIFCFASHIDSFGELHKTPSRGISLGDLPLVLLRVCKEWHHITLATSELFTQLYVSDKDSVDISTIIPLWLKHSKNLPLEVYMHYNELRNGTNLAAINIVFSQLREHLHRVTFLSFSVCDLPLLVPHGTDVRLPQLNHLELLPFPVSPLSKLHLDTGLVYAPNVANVGMAVPTNFTHLHWGDNLTQFLCCKQGLLDQFSLFSLLTRHPNLEKCQVFYSAFLGTVPETTAEAWRTHKRVFPSVPLRKLRSMPIHYTPDSKILPGILRKLRTPNLESLQIRLMTFHEATTNLLPFITSWLSSSDPYKLYKLDISLGPDYGTLLDIYFDNLDNLLGCTPNLKELTIHGGRLYREEIETLHSQYYKELCPSLVKLQFESSILPMYEVIDMVESRTISDNCDENQSLQYFSVESVQWVDQNGYDMEPEIAFRVLIHELENRCPSLRVAVVPTLGVHS